MNKELEVETDSTLRNEVRFEDWKSRKERGKDASDLGSFRRSFRRGRWSRVQAPSKTRRRRTRT